MGRVFSYLHTLKQSCSQSGWAHGTNHGFMCAYTEAHCDQGATTTHSPVRPFIVAFLTYVAFTTETLPSKSNLI